jgi:hypothetical protein
MNPGMISPYLIQETVHETDINQYPYYNNGGAVDNTEHAFIYFSDEQQIRRNPNQLSQEPAFEANTRTSYYIPVENIYTASTF